MEKRYKRREVYRGLVTIVPPGYAEVILPMNHGASPRESVVVFGVQDNGPSSSPSSLCEEIWSTVEEHIIPLGDGSVIYGPIRCRVNYGGGPIPGVGTSSAPGDNTIACPPSNVAVLVTKNTAEAGRKNRGRMYWPWFVEETSVSETGIIDSGYVSGHTTAFNAWQADLAIAGYDMVILHNDVGTPTTVSSLTCQSLVATQRRRLGRR